MTAGYLGEISKMDERIFDFQERLKMSHGISLSFDFRVVLLNEIPDAIGVRQATNIEDRTGIDWWVDRQTSRSLSIDLKARDKDFGKHDLALEIWSVVEDGVIGWTRNAAKATDYVLWFWKDSRRWCLLPFPMLCRVFNLSWREWETAYQTAKQLTAMNGQTWHSKCVFVPLNIVWASIIKQYGGQQ